MSYRQRKITVEFTLSDGRTFGNGQGNMLTITDASCFASIAVYGGVAGTQITLYIWGMSPAHMTNLSWRGVWRQEQSTANKMRLWADGRLIFEGDITDAYADYNQAPDIPLILTGQIHFNLRNQPAADFSAKGDVAVADIIRALASTVGLGFENQGSAAVCLTRIFPVMLYNKCWMSLQPPILTLIWGMWRKSPSGRKGRTGIFRRY